VGSTGQDWTSFSKVDPNPILIFEISSPTTIYLAISTTCVTHSNIRVRKVDLGLENVVVMNCDRNSGRRGSFGKLVLRFHFLINQNFKIMIY
jgi:hypothetical protein